MMVEITKNKPDYLDYAYVFHLLELFEYEENKVRKKVKTIVKDAQKENYNICVYEVKSNLTNLGVMKDITPIRVEYEKYKTVNLDKLVDKQFNKLTGDVKGQILNTLNTGKVDELMNLLETYFKIERKNQSLINRIMRVVRTENTILRSKVKLDVQEELSKQGIEVKRRWVHTMYNPVNTLHNSYAPRLNHLALNKVVEDSRGYFHTPNGVTKAPGMFGIPEEDINCRCDTEFVLLTKTSNFDNINL